MTTAKRTSETTKNKVKKTSTSTSTSTSKKKRTKPLDITVLNKNGKFVSLIDREKANFSVDRGKSKWVSDNTIQILLDHKDEKRLKEEVWKESKYVCYLCGKKMYRGHQDLTIDHIDPQRKGGSVLKKNMATCCVYCNREKGYRMPQTYIIDKCAVIFAMQLRMGRKTVWQPNPRKRESAKIDGWYTSTTIPSTP